MLLRRRTFLLVSFLLSVSLILAACLPTSPEGSAGPVQGAPVEPAGETTPLSPKEVTESFYSWYLDLAGDRSSGDFINPLVEGLYRQSEWLTAGFIGRVDQIVSGFDRGGYDPILLAQDIPVQIEVQEPTVDGAEATLLVLRYWGGNPEPAPMVVHLIQAEGQWLIDNVTPFETPVTDASAGPASPDAVAAAFYEWYLDYIGDPATEEFRNPLVDKAYLEAPYLTGSFVEHVDELLEAFRSEYGGFGYDPFLCAQDIPTEVKPEVTFERHEMASVVMTSSFPNHRLSVDLRQEGDEWLIGNITCAMEPAGVATVFYTWYLGYIGDRSSGEFRNPLVDKAYQDFPLLDEALVAEVDALLAGFDRGGYDPFLLAQDIPQDFSVDPGVEEKTAVVHLQFGPDSARHLLVTMNESGLRIRSISEAGTPPAAGPASESAEAGTGAPFASDEYGFSLSYPAEWVLKEVDQNVSGIPEDWPVEAMWLLMPADVAEFLARPGPPDPTAPIIVAPFNVEVVIGDESALERVYSSLEGETARINGHEVTVLQRDPGYTQVIFAHPALADTWIVLTNWVTGFPGREAQAEIATPEWEPLLNSLQFDF
jgi:hypothetical protein